MARPAAGSARDRFVGAGRDRLYVSELGTGPPVVVLHGGPDFDQQYLRPDLDRLASQYRLVFYDQRGRGRSFAGPVADAISMATEVDDLDRIRADLGLPQVALLGHSWGAVLAMEYAARHPSRVSHLILLHTAPATLDGWAALRSEVARRRTADEVDQLATMRTDPAYLRGEPAADAAYYRIHYRIMVTSAEALDRVVGSLRRAFTPESVVESRAIEDRLWDDTFGSAEYDLFGRLGRIVMPVLVVHGEHDVVPLEVSASIARALPAGRLVVLPDCAHFSYLECPARLEATIMEFMSGSS